MDAQAGLHLCCSQNPEDRFSRVEAHLKLFSKYVIQAFKCPFYKKVGDKIGKRNEKVGIFNTIANKIFSICKISNHVFYLKQHKFILDFKLIRIKSVTIKPSKRNDSNSS